MSLNLFKFHLYGEAQGAYKALVKVCEGDFSSVQLFLKEVLAGKEIGSTLVLNVQEYFGRSAKISIVLNNIWHLIYQIKEDDQEEVKSYFPENPQFFVIKVVFEEIMLEMGKNMN